MHFLKKFHLSVIITVSSEFVLGVDSVFDINDQIMDIKKPKPRLSISQAFFIYSVFSFVLPILVELMAEPTEEELETIWSENTSDQVTACLQGREDVPEDIAPFDAASEMGMDQQRFINFLLYFLADCISFQGVQQVGKVG